MDEVSEASNEEESELGMMGDTSGVAELRKQMDIP